MAAKTDQAGEKDHEHLVVLDTFHLIDGWPRTVAGDCYCVRCCRPVAYWLVPETGQAWPCRERIE